MGQEVIDKFEGEYRFLSNFYTAQVKYIDIMYPTSEHAFQAQKTLSGSLRKVISRLSTPGEAKKMGRRIPIRKDWEQIKNQVMYNIVMIKFACNPSLIESLLLTEGHELVEMNSWGDVYWGVDEYGKGKNYLGQILMKVRDEIMKVLVGGELVMRDVRIKVDGVKGVYGG